MFLCSSLLIQLCQNCVKNIYFQIVFFQDDLLYISTNKKNSLFFVAIYPSHSNLLLLKFVFYLKLSASFASYNNLDNREKAIFPNNYKREHTFKILLSALIVFLSLEILKPLRLQFVLSFHIYFQICFLS